MYWLPSASQTCGPSPRTKKGGSPSTERKARTGEFTPPGMNCSARFCSARDWSKFRGMVSKSFFLKALGESWEPWGANLGIYQAARSARCEASHKLLVGATYRLITDAAG